MFLHSDPRLTFAPIAIPQRRSKARGNLPQIRAYQDERFSYVAIARGPRPARAPVVRIVDTQEEERGMSALEAAEVRGAEHTSWAQGRGIHPVRCAHGPERGCRVVGVAPPPLWRDPCHHGLHVLQMNAAALDGMWREGMGPESREGGGTSHGDEEEAMLRQMMEPDRFNRLDPETQRFLMDFMAAQSDDLSGGELESGGSSGLC